MSTRGAYGFRIDGEDKVTYNQSDSYPEGLGEMIVSYIKGRSVEDVRKIARRIVLTDQDISGKGDLWKYDSLAHGGDGPKLMSDDQEFLRNSLFCEYAYIINLDKEVLEFYLGWQDEKGVGRYTGEEPTYFDCYGVTLAKEFPIEEVQSKSVEEIVEEMNQISKARFNKGKE